MNIQKNGINLLLVAEAILLIVVLVLGLVSGATGVIRDITGNSENQNVAVNTEDEWDPIGTGDSEGGSEENTESNTDDEPETGRWSIPEDYTEVRVTFSDAVEAKLASMTMEQKVAQLFIVTPEALTGYNTVTAFGNASKEVLNQYPVGGLVYSTKNFQNEAQMQLLLKGAKDYSLQQFGYTLFTMVEEGSVDALASVGVDTFETSGINEALKYFPGKANATDNGSGILSSAESLEELSNGSFILYQEGIDAGATFVMIGNVIVESITDDENVPCCLSSRTVGLLRGSMGFDGVIMTENFSDAAFTSIYGAESSCVEAIKAGVDMIYMPADFVKAYSAVLEAVNNGNISADRLNNAVGRILTAKGV